MCGAGGGAGWGGSFAKTHAAIMPAVEETRGTALVGTAVDISTMLSWTRSSTLRPIGQ